MSNHDPMDAFVSGRLSLEHVLTDEGWAYLAGVANIMREKGVNPSWVVVKRALDDMGIVATDRPLERVLRTLVANPDYRGV